MPRPFEDDDWKGLQARLSVESVYGNGQNRKNEEKISLIRTSLLR